MSKFDRSNIHNKHIIDALKELPDVMINNEGFNVSIRVNANRYETGIEHIAKNSHWLLVKDIKQIPKTLREPLIVKPDPRKNKKNYYSKVYYSHKFTCFLKIVTRIKPDRSEEIITIFKTNNLN